MTALDGLPGSTGDDGSADGVEVAVTAHHTTPDRVVFTERDNTDGWIATDHTVELEQ